MNPEPKVLRQGSPNKACNEEFVDEYVFLKQSNILEKSFVRSNILPAQTYLLESLGVAYCGVIAS